MAKPRARNPESTEPSGAAPPDRDPDAPSAPTLRRWLAAIVVLVTVPWLFVAGAFLWQPREAVSNAAPTSMPNASPVRPGPWGHLVTTPITISPPLDYIPRESAGGTPIEWSFPAVTGTELEGLLVAAGLSQQDAAHLRSTARSIPALNAVVVTPSPELVTRLSPESRARLYLTLGRIGASSNNGTINAPQATAFRYLGASPRDWIGTLVSPDTRNLVEPLIYRHEGFLYFADLEIVRSRISNPDDVQRLVKRLLRQRTMLVRLVLDEEAPLTEIAEYWGRGGRRTDLLPLLESVEPPGEGDAFRTIDIVHLLPPTARYYLYRYPRPTLRNIGQSPLTNCLWTAFNFFKDVPEALDKRYLEVEYGTERLKTDYYVVYNNFQLGDIVAFWDESGRLVHVAVHLAGDLLFTKNGSSELSPWTILPLGDLDGHFVEYSHAWRVTYHRLKSI